MTFFSLMVSGQSSEQLHNYLPPVKGWKLSPDIEIFNRDNLYERINGAAPLFFENNFEEMTSMEYKRGDDYITIQAYRHTTPVDAFGMYASERSSEMKYYPGIGGEAQGDDYGLFFFSGPIYVKMMASNNTKDIQDTMLQIGKDFAKRINSSASYPDIFLFFPKEGLIPYTQAYITKSYIGHEFLKSVYVADYNYQGKKIQAFVIESSGFNASKAIVDAYFEFTKQKDSYSEGELTFTDRYNGNIPVIWRSKYIIGVFDEKGEDFSSEIYDFLRLFHF